MIKAAIEKIIALAAPTITVIDGISYSDRTMIEVEEKRYYPSAIKVGSLTSLLEFISAGGYDSHDGIFLHVYGYHEVRLLSKTDAQENRANFCFAGAPPFENNSRPMSIEAAIIKLHCDYRDTPERTALLNVISCIAFDQNTEAKDNGISQTITVKKGTVMKGLAELKSPCWLAPNAGFAETPLDALPHVVRVSDKFEVSLISYVPIDWAAKEVAKIKSCLRGQTEVTVI